MNLLVYVVLFFVFLLLVISIVSRILVRPKSKEDYTAYLEGLEAIIDGKKDKAIKLLRKVLEKDPSNIESYLYTGNLLREKGKITKAIKIHKNLLVNPLLTKNQKIKLKEALAEDYMDNKEWGKALPLLEQLYRLNPGDSILSDKLMSIYEKLGKLNEAFKIAKRSFATDKLAHYTTYLASKALEEHSKQVNKFISIGEKANISYAYYLHGKLLISEGDESEGLTYLKKGISLEPDKAFLYFPLLEEYMFEEGKFSILEPYLKSKFEENPSNTYIFEFYISILKKRGEFEKAKEILEQSVRNFNLQDSRVLLSIAILYNGIDENKVSEYLTRIKNKIDKKELYRCSECNYKTEEFSWKCSNCGSFGTFQLIRS